MEHVWITTEQGKVHLINYRQSELKEGSKIVVCIHGAHSDARIFNYLGSQLSESGYNVFSLDLLGHGQSDGPIGDSNFGDCLLSINQVIKTIRQGMNNISVYLLGHSFGCTYVLWYAHEFASTVNGLILMAPYLRIKGLRQRSRVEPNNVFFLYLLLRRLITPKRMVKFTDLLPGTIVIGGKELSLMLDDKKLNFYYSYRYIVDVLALKNSKIKEISTIKTPVLLLHGKKDLHFYPEISEAFFKLLASEYKSIKMIDCDHWFNHAVFYEQNLSLYSELSRISILHLIDEWIEAN
jgi:alpha-beta hydrolase superfamily lysophospholipase